jgi:LDH2 family malate/lactate/ureidoglycolate dehydrogenase
MSESVLPVRVAADDARALAEGILIAVGANERVARRVVDSLLYADLHGIGTHGLMRLKHYVERVQAGGIDPSATVECVREAPASALLDGGNGFGAVVTTRAMDVALEKAAMQGTAAVVARNMNHFGAAAYYATMASERGMVGIVMVNVTASMAPTGGMSLIVGNNPIAFAFPSAGDDPIVFDAATSRSSWGSLFRAAQRNETLAEGAFLGADGLPTTDPETVMQGGSLQPIEGYKGYGLALCIGLLTGVLGGGKFDSEIAHPYRVLTARGDNSALVLAISIDHFAGREAFARRASALGDEIRSGPRAPGGDTIMVPGDREHAVARSRRTHVLLEARTVSELEGLAHELDVEMPAIASSA